MAFQPLPHTIVAMDIVGSGNLDDLMLLASRADVRMIAGATLAQQGIDVASLETHDLGDGLRFVVPGVITPPALLDPFVPNLDTALRQHRKRVNTDARLRLRVAVHHGLVHRDNGVAAGEPLRVAARLLDAKPVRQAIALAEEANLVLVVSQAMYDGVVRHGYGLDPALYQEISIAEKELATKAWVYVPGHTPGLPIDVPAPPAAEPPPAQPQQRPKPGPPPAARPGEAARRSEVNIHTQSGTFWAPIVGGDYNA
jgi:hypothetical protein